MLFSGWDSWTRTNEMQESKSCAFTNLAISQSINFSKKALKVFTFKAFCVSIELSSRLVSKQVLLPLQSLTSVFGMGTGGPFAFETLTLKQVRTVLLLILSDLFSFPHRVMQNRFFQSSFEIGSGNLPVVHRQGFEPGTH